MLGGQILLGREIQAPALVGDRTECGDFRSGVPDWATRIRSGQIPAAPADRPDVFRGLVDCDEGPPGLYQISFFEPCFGTQFRRRDRLGNAADEPIDT